MHRGRDLSVMYEGYARIMGTILASERNGTGKRWETIRCNNLWYCKKHGRDVCHECEHCEMGFATLERVEDGFKIPDNGRPEYPVAVDNEDLESTLLAKRWLALQRVTYCAPTLPVKCSNVKLPKLKSGGVQAETLLGIFRQLLPMCTTQRYFYANQPSILIQDFETFEQATLLYEGQLHQSLDSLLFLNPHGACDFRKKARASIFMTFGILLQLNIKRTFWRKMELNTEAYITLLESYSEADEHVALTGEAKSDLLQWIGDVYWSLRQSQDVLNELHKVQHVVYQNSKFPFYPWNLDTLKGDPEGDLDLHLTITKLSRGPAYDFHFMAAAFNALRRANEEYPEQMVHVNYAMMVAIDEMSARFRVLELLTHVGQVVATRQEVKKALFCFKFDELSIDLHSALSDSVTVITEVSNTFNLKPTPKIRSSLQELLVLERNCRIKHKEKFLSLPVQDSRDLIRDLFDHFKPLYTKIYKHIRLLWRPYERSLLSSEAKTEHWLQRKKNKKKASDTGASGWEAKEMAEARRVTDQSFVDPAIFWAVGDRSVERYKPPIVREKIKTQKMSIATPVECLSSATSPPPAHHQEAPSPMPRSLDQLKESDLTTREILWRKMKGSVRWSNVVQFLARLGCSIMSLDGSRKKVVDEHTGRCTVLHRPHPSDECRRDQLDSYRMHLEDWLLINYEDVVTSEERSSSSRSTSMSLLDSSKESDVD